MSKLQDYLDRLPDAFLKLTDSNLGKFLQIVADEIGLINEIVDEVEEVKKLENADGKTLDLHGGNVGQLRGQAHDELYRLLIRSKIQSNLSGGDVNAIIDYIVTLLRIDRDDIELVEPDWEASDYESASFEIRVPLNVLTEMMVTIDQFTTVISRLSAAGVRPWLIGEGAFQLYGEPEFDENGNYIPQIDEDDSDGSAGLSDEEQEIGGFLSAVYQPPKDAQAEPLTD